MKTEATRFQCGLCGAAFTHGDRACAGCELGASCLLVKCPRCGYQFPRESRLLALLGRLLASVRRAS
jgi:hypothetical protein